jgi:hypothetical protein
MDKKSILLKINLVTPPPGVAFGVQKGSGKRYETTQKKISVGGNLEFIFEVGVKFGKDEQPDFHGPFVHGSVGQRFIYIDIGVAAGQMDSIWTRRLKVPLRNISWQMIDDTKAGMLETTVPGTAKDGGPNCATVKDFTGWNGVSSQ